MARIIPLTKGMIAIVDEEVYHWIRPYSWYAVEGRRGCFYAQTQWPVALSPKGKVIYKTRELQRIIMDPNDSRPSEDKVDHVDFNTLDCRKQNLRWLSHHDNNLHSVYTVVASSGYRGIEQRFMGGCMKYRASVKFEYKSRVGSYTPSLNQAMQDYNKLARHFHGRFAHQHVMP